MKLGYMGPQGTFSEEAALRYDIDKKYELISVRSIPGLFRALILGQIDCAIVPVENSTEGAVGVTLDMLACETPLYIVDELVLEVDQYLLVNKGVLRRDIRKILSHPQSLGQCVRYLEREFQGIDLESTTSTSEAAVQVVNSSASWAAIGSLSLARNYNLDVLEGPVQDQAYNRTRFLILSREMNPRLSKKKKKKVSILFSTPNRPGSLYRVLQILDVWNLNMTRIESRPSKERLGKYLFFVDFDGDAYSTETKTALEMIQKRSIDFRFLGNYLAWEEK